MNVNLLYIDPMSYNNLQIYDDNLLSNISNDNFIYFCNTKYSGKFNSRNSVIKNYDYSDKKGLSKLISYIHSQIKLFMYVLRNKNINLIHFQWLKLPYFDYILLIVLKVISKANIVFTAHNFLPHDTGNKYKKIFCKIYKKVDAIIVHTEKTKSKIVDDFKFDSEKITVIPHGSIELECDNNKITKTLYDFKKNHKVNGEIIFIFPGMIRESKGIDDLLNSWIQSSELSNSKKCKLIIAGSDSSGILNKYDLSGINNILCDIRFLSNEEFEAYIKISDVVVLPYREISQSGILLTCIKSNTPVIVSDVGGLTDPFEYGCIGWSFKPTNTLELKRIMEMIVKDPTKLYTIQNDSTLWDKLNNEIYSWKFIGQSTNKLYVSVCSKS